MSTNAKAPLALLGAAGSPYTRKMLALLRFRRIPHAIHWGSHRNPPPGLPEPKLRDLAQSNENPAVRSVSNAEAG